MASMSSANIQPFIDLWRELPAVNRESLLVSLLNAAEVNRTNRNTAEEHGYTAIIPSIKGEFSALHCAIALLREAGR